MKNIIAVAVLIVVGIGAYSFFTKPAELPMDKQVDVAVTEIPENEMQVKSYVDVSPIKAKEMIDEDSSLIVIDVSPKYDEGHLPGAINYYVGDGSLEEAIPSLDKEAMYLVYCHTDEASMLGSQMLVDAGFMNVYRLEGNYAAWVEAGYDIEK